MREKETECKGVVVLWLTDDFPSSDMKKRAEKVIEGEGGKERNGERSREEAERERERELLCRAGFLRSQY